MAWTNKVARWAACALLGLMIAGIPTMAAMADDTELFTRPNSAPAPTPNVMIYIDSSTNQDSGTMKPLQVVMQQLKAVIGSFAGKRLAVGIMFTSDAAAGAYVRVAPKDMGIPANVTALQNMAQDILDANYGPTGLRPFPDSDQSGGQNPDNGAMMNEVYKFYAGAAVSAAGVDSQHRDYAANLTFASAASYGLTTGNALASSSASTTYVSPLSLTVPCAKNYLIIFGIGIPQNAPINQSPIIQAANGGVAPSVIPISGDAIAQGDWTDEWARFLYSRGVPTATPGVYSPVITYTIDFFAPGKQDIHQTRLFQSAARVGGGRSFAATSGAEVNVALTSIFNETQAVNSVFSSVTLPVSVNVRGTNLNQVYLGVFRPDPDALPNWPGNLKEYKLGVDSNGNIKLVDSLGADALSSSTGFFNQSVVSYWTSGNSYWTFAADPTAQNPNSDSADGPLVERGGAGEMLRWNIAGAGSIRTASGRTVYTYVGASPAMAVNLTTSSPSYLFSVANSANLTPASFGLLATDTAGRDNVVNWIRGADLNDENGDGATTDMRPRAHGDVIHSRPSVINYNRYGDDNDVVVFYGANDGLLHAVQGGQAATPPNSRPVGGGEYWAFAAPEFFTAYPRQFNNSPSISWAPPKPATFTATGFFVTGSNTVAILPDNPNLAYGQTVSGAGMGASATTGAVSGMPGIVLSNSATSSLTGAALSLQPPGEQSSPMTTAQLQLGSANVSFAGGGLAPSWLVRGMSLSGAGIPAGTTVTNIVTAIGAPLNGGATATSSNTGAAYTFSNPPPSSTINNLTVVSGSSTGYSLSGSTGTAGRTYTPSGSLAGAVPTGSVLGTTGSVPAVTLTSAPAGAPGSVAAGVQLTFEGPAISTGKVSNTPIACAPPSCVITYFAAPTAAPVVGERVSIAGCGTWTALGPVPTVTSVTGASVTVALPAGQSCTTASRAVITFYPRYVASGAIATVGRFNVPITGAVTGNASTIPASGTILVGASGGAPALGYTLTGAVTSWMMTTMDLGNSATASANGSAVYQSAGVGGTVATCSGDTVTGGGAVNNLTGCATASITPGLTVSGPGVPAGSTTSGLTPNLGFVMSAAATAGIGSNQSVTAFYPWVGNTLSGTSFVQVSSPTDLSLVSNGWTVVGSGIPASTTVSNTQLGTLEFVAVSPATTASSGASGNTLTFTNPVAGSPVSGPKPYFFDGPIGLWRYDAPNTGAGATASTGDGKIIAGSCNTGNAADCDKAIIFVPMRRGGRMIYAFDVTDPATPKLLWKKGCAAAAGSASCDAGFEEMGQTWSMPQAMKMNISGATKPVLIFGGGYDPAYEDNDPVAGARAMGRSLMFIDALTGAPIKVFKGTGTNVNADVASAMSAAQTTAADKMTCSIPSDVAALAKDPATGYAINVFRVMVGDACGQIWRVDTADSNPNNWLVTRFATVGSAYYSSAAGGSLTGAPLAVRSRKFLFAPDIVYGGSDSNGAYNYVLIGSGDREHPFNGYGDAQNPTSLAVRNSFFMFKDYNTGSSYSASSPLINPPTVMIAGTPTGGSFPMTEATLYDATADLVQVGSAAQRAAALSGLASYNGWHIRLGNAEKVVGGATSASGSVYFGTNIPGTFTNSCVSNLGTARLYQVNLSTAGAAVPSALSPVTSASQRYSAVPGGGLPPTPVPVSVIINGKFKEGIISGTQVQAPADSVVGSRIRVYTKRSVDKKN